MKYLFGLLCIALVPAQAQHIFPARGQSVNHVAVATTLGAATTTDGNGIDLHGGSPLLGTPTTYVIWYGNWAPSSPAVLIVNNFLANIGGSPYMGVNATYHDGSGVHVSGLVASGTQVYDAYSRGATITDADIQAIVAAHLGHDLPVDSNGIYFVLTSADVAESGPFGAFKSSYCGWHNQAVINGLPIRYSFVGDAGGSLSCLYQAVGPNGSSGGDGIANVAAHELEEAISDPDVSTGWYDSGGAENADKCAWQRLGAYSAGNGSLANMKLGGLDYMIQPNWVNAKGGGCVLSDTSATWPTISVLAPAPSTVFQCDSTNHFTITASVSAIDYLGNAIPQGPTGLYWQLGLQGSTADQRSGLGEGFLYYTSPQTLTESCVVPWNGLTYYISGGSVTARVSGFPNQASVAFTVKQYVIPPPPPPPCVSKNKNSNNCHTK